MSEIFYLKNSNREYPSEDFISSKYDKKSFGDVSKVVIIVSTPRSGSTFLCDSIYSATGAIGHEYFQPHGYLQSLAKRWGCMEGNGVNKPRFVKKLIDNRASSGVLVVNLHASHLEVFKSFLNYFPSAKISCVHLIRGDVLSQAVSFYIASKTGAWSTAYDAAYIEETSYSYAGIKEKLDKIQSDNVYASCFLKKTSINHKVVLYEDLKESAGEVVEYLTGHEFSMKEKSSRIKQQANGLNEYFKKRFAFEYIERR